MKKGNEDFIKKGDPYILLTSMGLVFTLTMVFVLLGIILVNGLGIFWPSDLYEVKLSDNRVLIGEKWATDLKKSQGEADITRSQLKIGNRDIYGFDFAWFQDKEVESIVANPELVLIERYEYGNFYGYIESLHTESNIYDKSSENFVDKILVTLSMVDDLKEEFVDKRKEHTDLLSPLNEIRRGSSLLKMNEEYLSSDEKELLSEYEQQEKDFLESNNHDIVIIENEISDLDKRINEFFITVRTGDGIEKEIHLKDIVRFHQPNIMNVFSKTIHYLAKVWEFVYDGPRESNTEGGVFPAIFGTVMMVILMSILVVPFGVLTALYLNEYAKQGPIIRMIRLSVNNLAGVPSIVYGIFGLGFFVYMIGGSIDSLFFADKLPEPTLGTGGILWASVTLALLTLPVVVVATEEGILAVPKANKEGALALGATKWQMIKDIVLPNAMPGILTGLILAISRGAGEVAPLMITGVVKLAPAMPFDMEFPFLHLDRKFMHLGFHIYDVGFQSPNVEAAMPMVYSTALLLIVIVVLLNIFSIYLRNQLKKKYKTSSF
ncbi:MAG: phosphate ABC transporter permease PstA [Bacteroidetes bacterium]|nr:phosphate ABC transporter permease PstA [Bacteroidota bacterium]